MPRPSDRLGGKLDRFVRIVLYQRDMIAWMNAGIGIVLSFAVGMKILHFSPTQVGTCILASEVAGLIALLATLQAERVRWIRKHVLTRSLKTWVFFAGLYLGLMLAWAPALRGILPLAWMFIPLALGNGLAILIFGPIQDRLVRREQRRSQLGAAKTS